MKKSRSHDVPFLVLLMAIQWVAMACGSENQRGAEKTARPNILFIMADDHTTQAISCYDGLFANYAKTVHIDRLAEEGMRFTNAFCANAIFSPSRATMLTGKYSHKNGVRCLGEPFDTLQATSATLLQEAGYQTAVFGKWHLKTTPTCFDYSQMPCVAVPHTMWCSIETGDRQIDRYQ